MAFNEHVVQVQILLNICIESIYNMEQENGVEGWCGKKITFGNKNSFNRIEFCCSKEHGNSS